jgi:hypothetical protein
MRGWQWMLGCSSVGVQLGCLAPEPPPLELSGTASNSASDESADTNGGGLSIDCQTVPLTAVGATWSHAPLASGLVEGVTYTYSASGLPPGLAIDASTGVLGGVVAADPGLHVFEVMVAEDLPGGDWASGVCNLQVRERFAAPIDIGEAPCLQPGDDLRDLVLPNTGDDTDIVCEFMSGAGNGRMPNGMEVDNGACTVTGTLDEDRAGTWVFIVAGMQSGVEVFVPYCVTHDLDQGYDVTVRHSGSDDAALLPIAREYDPLGAFSVGTDMDPRFEITAPGICGASCFYTYAFLRTDAPIGDGGFGLDPDGFMDDGDGQNIGFFHELRLSGPPVPEEFLERPWVLSVETRYCISGSDTGCDDPFEDGDASLEFGVIMVPGQ